MLHHVNVHAGPEGNVASFPLRTIDDLLKQAGTSKHRVLRAEIFLSDIANFAEMNKAWDAWVTPGSAPARATVEAKLAKPEFLVEIAVTAAV